MSSRYTVILLPRRLVYCRVFEGSSWISSLDGSGGYSEPWVFDQLEEVVSITSATSDVPGGSAGHSSSFGSSIR